MNWIDVCLLRGDVNHILQNIDFDNNEELKERLEFYNDDYTSVYLKGCADTKEKYQQVIDKLRKYLVDTIPSSFDVAEYSVARIKDILKEVE